MGFVPHTLSFRQKFCFKDGSLPDWMGLHRKNAITFAFNDLPISKLKFAKHHMSSRATKLMSTLTILWKMKILSCTKMKSASWIICCYWYRKQAVPFLQRLKLENYADSIGTYKFFVSELTYFFILSHNITIRMHSLHCFPNFKLHIFQLASVVSRRLVGGWNSSWTEKPTSSTYQTRVLI